MAKTAKQTPLPEAGSRPKQARSIRTEQALLDAFEAVLRTKPYADLTVSEIAAEAGVTTGAIYRRFRDKQDLLRSAFIRFYEKTKANTVEDAAKFRPSFSDRQLVTNLLKGTLQFTLENIHLMKAANSLDDAEAFDHMIASRTFTADWFAGLLKTSTLSERELKRRCRFVMRIATASFRDTLFSGHAAVQDQNDYLKTHGNEIKNLIADLTEMAAGYLKIEG